MGMKTSPRKARGELLENCRAFLEDMRRAERYLSIGRTVQVAVQEANIATLAPGGLTSQSAASATGTADVDVQAYRRLTQALVVQEWNLYLNEVFRIAVVHQMSHRGTLPALQGAMKPDLSQMPFQALRVVRQEVAARLTDAFSFAPYDQRLGTVRKLYIQRPLSDSWVRSSQTIKKHVIIRNVCQHHRGLVRRSDVEDLGYGSIALLDDARNERKYAVGSRLCLSTHDIEALIEAMETASAGFEGFS